MQSSERIKEQFDNQIAHQRSKMEVLNLQVTTVAARKQKADAEKAEFTILRQALGVADTIIGQEMDQIAADPQPANEERLKRLEGARERFRGIISQTDKMVARAEGTAAAWTLSLEETEKQRTEADQRVRALEAQRVKAVELAEQSEAAEEAEKKAKKKAKKKKTSKKKSSVSGKAARRR